MNNENVQVVKKLMESEIERIQQRFSSEDCELNKHIIAVLKSLKAIYERLDQVDCAMESVFLNRKLNLQVEPDLEASKSASGVLCCLWFAQFIAFRLNCYDEFNFITSLNYLEKHLEKNELIAAANAPDDEFLSERELQW